MTRRTTGQGDRSAKRPAVRAARRPAVSRPRTGATRAGAGRGSAEGRRGTGGLRWRAASRTPRSLKLATGPFRLWSAFCVVAFLLSLFSARLVQLQGIDENDYAALAVEKGAQTITLEAPRASIYDRNGVALAESVDAAKLVADPTFTADNATAIATILHERLGLDYIEALKRLNKPDTRYVELARHLAPQRAEAVVNTLAKARLAGVYSASDTLRVYPDDDVAANVLGFVLDDNSGGAGLESSLNSTLSGTDGSATSQVSDGQELPLADKTVTEPKEGTGVRLTLDENLQLLAQTRLARAVKEVSGSSGAAVIVDVKTGQLLALADYPTFDPNHYASFPEENYGSRAVQDIYEPGSVQKALTFAGLIDGGYVTPRTRIVVPPVLPRPGSPTGIHDYFTHPTLRLTAAGVLAKSSNIGTVRAAERMSKETMYGYLRSFGLGSKPGLGLDGEGAGLLPQWQDWQRINQDTMSFGQGLSVTAVQMAAAIAAIGNQGVYVQPSLIESYVDHDGDVTPAPAPETHRVVSAKAAHQVARMMEGVVGPEGTAPHAAVEGYRVAGKTGTAQRADSRCQCYRGTTVSFAGFAPADAPRFAIYVVVQQPYKGAGGASTGAPVFHDLMVATLQKFGVPPTQSREPAYPISW